MKKLVSVLILSAMASVAQAGWIGSIEATVDAQNPRIVDFKKVMVDGDEIIKKDNPYYGPGWCNVFGFDCVSKYIFEHNRVPGYEITVTFDSKDNGDVVPSGDSYTKLNNGTRWVTIRASDFPMAADVPHKLANRVALARSMFKASPATAVVVHHPGAYYEVKNQDFVVTGKEWVPANDTLDYRIDVETKN